MGIALIPHREKLPTPLRTKKGKGTFLAMTNDPLTMEETVALLARSSTVIVKMFLNPFCMIENFTLTPTLSLKGRGGFFVPSPSRGEGSGRGRNSLQSVQIIIAKRTYEFVALPVF